MPSSNETIKAAWDEYVARRIPYWEHANEEAFFAGAVFMLGFLVDSGHGLKAQIDALRQIAEFHMWIDQLNGITKPNPAPVEQSPDEIARAQDY